MQSVAEQTELTVEGLVTAWMPRARAMARRCEGHGADPADLESDAMLALLQAAQHFVGTDQPEEDFGAWAQFRISAALRKVVRDAPYQHVRVPARLREAAEKCRVATECLKARGIERPNAHQIAGESLLSRETVEIVLEIPGVIVRQSAVEWAENKATTRGPDEPELVPAFGPQPGWSPDRACQEVCRHPVPKGSSLCCMQCHESGQDHHPALKRSKFTDPPPETKRVAAPRSVAVDRQHETRAQRRQRLFPPLQPVSA